MVKETIIIDADGRSLSEIDRIVSRGLGGLRCPSHGSSVTYEPPSLDTQTGIGRTSYAIDVICCCEELLGMTRILASR